MESVDGQLLQNYFFSANRPSTTSVPSYEQVEVLAKEFTQQVSGLYEHTVQRLVLQNKIPHIRTGQVSTENSRAEVGIVGLF